MKAVARMRRVAVAAAIALAVGLAYAAGDQPSSSAKTVQAQNKVPGAVESAARRLTNGFRQRGYEVVRGYFKLYTRDDCPRSFEVMHNCFGNNPAAPYVLPVVPPWPEEWVDPATVGAFGDTIEGYNVSYRLDPREAIVILGVLPPPADYFGVQTYLFTHPGSINPDSTQYKAFARAPYMRETFFGAVPGNPGRLQVMSNLSDSNNHVVIANQSGAVWDELRYFVITPDQAMDRVVRDAFARIGVDGRAIFTEPIPSALGPHPDTQALTLGLDSGADDFVSAIRYAMPQDGGGTGTRSDTWRRRLPLVVLRIRATQGVAEPYPALALQPRTATTPPEIALRPDLITLVKAICEQWEQPCDVPDAALQLRAPEFLNMQVFPFQLTGPECLPVGMNCLAPTEDTTYFLSGKLPLDDDSVYAVVGAVSTLTENASYIGLGLNSSMYKFAFDNIADETLAGTADDYSGVPHHGQFFVQYFARDCSGLGALVGTSRCYSIGDVLPRCMEPSDLTCEMLVLSLRGYIRPTTQRGTDPRFALSPRFLKLRRP